MIKLDYVPATNYKIYQDDLNFKYTTDSLILSSFAKPKGVCIDLGCGSGILSLRMIDKSEKFINIDANEEAISLLNKSVEINGLENKIQNYIWDVGAIDEIVERNSIDTVLTNPPYYKDGLRVDNERYDKARYSENLEIFVEAASYALKDLGRFYMVISAGRMIDAFEILVSKRIEPKRIRFVKKNAYSLPKLILIEGVKYAKRGFFFERDFLLTESDDMSEDLREVYRSV
ncbi:putative SAM-dependent methyltransferase [Peptoniphilus sp. ING2-D1G]|nr:putative SAM-dependent methyltransferase [Peptoniphilus sp. ING2-D1G]